MFGHSAAAAAALCVLRQSQSAFLLSFSVDAIVVTPEEAEAEQRRTDGISMIIIQPVSAAQLEAGAVHAGGGKVILGGNRSIPLEIFSITGHLNFATFPSIRAISSHVLAIYVCLVAYV